MGGPHVLPISYSSEELWVIARGTEPNRASSDDRLGSGALLAKLEDKCLFIADGTATYADIVGIGKYCDDNVAYLVQLAAGKTKPSDATINDFRNLRAAVNPAVLADGAAYYLSSTFDALLPTFNTIGQPLIYQRMPDGTAKLDGYPVRWINVSQAYTTAAAANKYLSFFGNLSYWYLGERGAPRITSVAQAR